MTIHHYSVVCGSADRDEWLAHRASGIGASEIAQVLGESPFGSALSLYAQKIDAYDRDLSDSEPVYWGQRLEGVILEAYSERTGRPTRRAGQLLRSTAHPWALCTLDGETSLPAEPDAWWPLEIKNSSSFHADAWENGPPAHYYLQIQQQMLVTGAEKATIAALLGGQRMVWADVPRDETTIRRIIYHGERFWSRVQGREPPAPDGTEESKRALASLYPDGSGIVVMPGSALDAADRLESVKAELKALESEKTLIENTVRAAIGPAEVGMLLDGRSFSWKLQHRRETVMAASSFRVLRLHQSKKK